MIKNSIVDIFLFIFALIFRKYEMEKRKTGNSLKPSNQEVIIQRNSTNFKKQVKIQYNDATPLFATSKSWNNAKSSKTLNK